MPDLKRKLIHAAFALLISTSAIACGTSAGGNSQPVLSPEGAGNYRWTKAADHAAFPESYNFPLFNAGNRLWAFHSEGNWYSEDGRNWARAELPPLGLNTAYQRYVQFNGAIYALGTMEGNYQNLRLGSRIARTRDFRRWEVVAEKSELPARVFYSAIVFKGKIWLLGGFDGKSYYHDVWNSVDGVKWRRVVEACPWEPRSGAAAVVFKSRIWLIGGGVTDGPIFNDAWSSEDGVKWERATGRLATRPAFGYTAIVYDGQIWLVGANRDGRFKNAMLVSNDGVNWTEQGTPWTPRGGVAACVYDGKLFMTGGKYSVTEGGNIMFIYSNDVWCMSRS